MTPDEFDKMLHDAEIKLARLRALYEQWFQGIERLEPHVARKDLDRSFELLRKGQPRNTALRFRLQQTIARYGTYITYWQRIGRQIEEGTYKRDLVRVKKKHMNDAAPDRPEPSSWEIDVDIDSVEGGLALDETDVDAILGALGNAREKSLRPLSPLSLKPVPAASPAHAAGAAASAAPRGLSPFAAFAKPGGARPAPTVTGAAAAGAPSAAASVSGTPPRGPGQSLSGGARPDVGAPKSTPTPAAGAQTPLPTPQAASPRPVAPATTSPPTAPPTTAAAPPTAATPAAPTAQRSLTPLAAAPPQRSLTPFAAARPAGAVAAAPAPRPDGPAATQANAGRARPAAAAKASPAASAAAGPIAARAPAGRAPTAAPRDPAVAPRTPAAASGPGGLDERTMRAVYERYADARRKNNEGDVRFETLAQSVEKMMPKLREKHGGKKIDFDIVVANGRVGLKPKVEE